MAVRSSEPTRYEERGGVAVVTMDDGKVNALGAAMLAALGGACERAERGLRRATAALIRDTLADDMAELTAPTV